MKNIEFANFKFTNYNNNLVNSSRLSVSLKYGKNSKYSINIWGKYLPLSHKTGDYGHNGIIMNSYDENTSKAIISRFKSLKDGIESGYFIELVLKGIGFKVFQFEKTLFLQLGFSHFYIYHNIGEDLILRAKRDRILIFGSDKQVVGNIAYEIASLRKPDSYKAKGIQFKDKVYILKEGKKK
jgi:large subunit ribosomal protein L6